MDEDDFQRPCKYSPTRNARLAHRLAAAHRNAGGAALCAVGPGAVRAAGRGSRRRSRRDDHRGSRKNSRHARPTPEQMRINDKTCVFFCKITIFHSGCSRLTESLLVGALCVAFFLKADATYATWHFATRKLTVRDGQATAEIYGVVRRGGAAGAEQLPGHL